MSSAPRHTDAADAAAASAAAAANEAGASPPSGACAGAGRPNANASSTMRLVAAAPPSAATGAPLSSLAVPGRARRSAVAHAAAAAARRTAVGPETVSENDPSGARIADPASAPERNESRASAPAHAAATAASRCVATRSASSRLDIASHGGFVRGEHRADPTRVFAAKRVPRDSPSHHGRANARHPGSGSGAAAAVGGVTRAKGARLRLTVLTVFWCVGRRGDVEAGDAEGARATASAAPQPSARHASTNGNGARASER